MRPAPTVVTCLYDLRARDRTHRRSVAEYLALAPTVLSTGHPIVAFADAEHAEALAALRSRLAPGAPTRVVARPFEALRRAADAERIGACLSAGRRSPAAQDPAKDTARYHALTWSKTDLLAEVAAENPFDSSHFWFVDLGIAHISRPHPDLALDELLVLAAAPLRALLFNETAPAEIADRDRYLATTAAPKVSGAVLGGDGPSIAHLATWFDAEVTVSLDARRPALEEVLLGPVVAEHRDAFTLSYGSDTSVWENLLEPRTDAGSLFRVLAQCRDVSLHDPGLAVASSIERAWRAGRLELSWQQAARLHLDGAALAWDSGRHDVAARAQLRLAELLERAPARPPDQHPPEVARPPTVALCMIVRDEAPIIERCLASVRDLIDHWVIVDTGSADETPAAIGRALEGIPGELHHRRWHDFARNRSELLALAAGAADYLLLIDADMTVHGQGPMPPLHADAYLLRHAGPLDYAVPRLVRGDLPWHYVGATHEHLAWEGERTLDPLPQVVIVDYGDGSSHDVKLERDRVLLERTQAEHPDDPRTLFYLARTYADLGDDDRAIDLFRRRVAAGGWDEEVFYAQYQLATLLARADWETGAAAFVDAWCRRPTRAEPLYELARGWRAHGRHDLSFECANRGLELGYPDDQLFVHREPYDHGLLFERSIAAYHLGDLETALADNDELLTRGVPSSLEPWVLHNRACCLQALGLDDQTPLRAVPRAGAVTDPVPCLDELVAGVTCRQVVIPTLEGWPCTNPSIAPRPDGHLAMIVRTVNYHLVGEHSMSYQLLDADGVVRTRNYLAELDDASLAVTAVRPLAMAPGGGVLPGPVIGLEDVRLIDLRGHWMASATVRDRNEAWRCEIALADLEADGHDLRVLRSPNGDRHEKNWMPFLRGDALHFVYSLAPTVVLRYDDRTGVLDTVSTCAAPPWADELRGGSQGLAVGGGHLFVAHEVASVGAGRDYRHRLVHLDGDGRITAASPPFRFLAPGIEFCAGIAPAGEDIVLSFGSEDRAAYLLRVPAPDLFALLEPVDVAAAPAAAPA